MKHLSATGYRTQPWKNGGGTTREIARTPETGDFDWRLSMATVEQDGPFSTFPGVDRTLTVLTGEGIALTVAGEEARLIPAAPFAFPGDAPAASRLLGGEVTDLNVMTRRGRCAHRVTHLAGPATIENAVLFALTDFTLAGVAVARFDTLLPDPGEVLSLPDGAQALLIELEVTQ